MKEEGGEFLLFVSPRFLRPIPMPPEFSKSKWITYSETTIPGRET